jgi:hypothetical protein
MAVLAAVTPNGNRPSAISSRLGDELRVAERSSPQNNINGQRMKSMVTEYSRCLSAVSLAAHMGQD